MNQRTKLPKLVGMKKLAEQARGEGRVTAILDACESLLNKKGYEQINLDQIIEKAQVSKGTFYHFFESKQSVYLSLMHQVLLEIVSAADPLPGEEKNEFLDYVLGLERRLEKIWQEHHGLVTYYGSNRYHPAFYKMEEYELKQAEDAMTKQLLFSRPDIGPAKAQEMCQTLWIALTSGLDKAALMTPKEAAGFQREWWRMIIAYINDGLAE